MTAPRVVRTMCPMNCHPTFCGMSVEFEGGKLKAVSGDKDNPDSQGFDGGRHQIKISVALRRASDTGTRARWPRMFGATMRGCRGPSGNEKVKP